MSKLFPVSKPPPKPTTYNNYTLPVKMDETYAGDIMTQFATLNYPKLVELLNNNFNYNFRNLQSGENLAFAVVKNVTQEMTEYQRLEIIKRLEEKGTPICSINQYNQTIAHIAGKMGYFDIVKYVAEKSCGIDVVDNYGNAPIHYCVDKLIFDCGKDKFFDENNKNQLELKTEADIPTIANNFLYDKLVEYIKEDGDEASYIKTIYEYVKLNKFFKIDDIEKIIDSRKKMYGDYVIQHKDINKLNVDTLKEFEKLYGDMDIKNIDTNPNFVSSEMNKNAEEKKQVIAKIYEVHGSLKQKLYDKIPNPSPNVNIFQYCNNYFNRFKPYAIRNTVNNIVDTKWSIFGNNADVDELFDETYALYSTYVNNDNIDGLNQLYLIFSGQKNIDEMVVNLTAIVNQLSEMLNDPDKAFNEKFDTILNNFPMISNDVKQKLTDNQQLIITDIKENRINDAKNRIRMILQNYWLIINDYDQLIDNFDKIYRYIDNGININDRNIINTDITHIEHNKNNANDAVANIKIIIADLEQSRATNYFVPQFIDEIKRMMIVHLFNSLGGDKQNAIKLSDIPIKFNNVANALTVYKSIQGITHINPFPMYQYEKYVLQMQLCYKFEPQPEECYYIISIMNNIAFIQQYLLDSATSYLQAMSIAINIHKFATEAIVYLIKLKLMNGTIEINFDDVYKDIIKTLNYVDKYINICNKQTSIEYFNKLMSEEDSETYINCINIQRHKNFSDDFNVIFSQHSTRFARTNIVNCNTLPCFKMYDNIKLLDDEYLTYFYMKDYNKFYGNIELFNYSVPYIIIDALELINTNNDKYSTGYLKSAHVGNAEKHIENNKIFEKNFENKISDGMEYQIIQTDNKFSRGEADKNPLIISLFYVNEIIKYYANKLFDKLDVFLNKIPEMTEEDSKHHKEINNYIKTILGKNTIKPILGEDTIKPIALKNLIILILKKSIKNMIDNQCKYLLSQTTYGVNVNADYKVIEEMQRSVRKRYFKNLDEQLKNPTPDTKRHNPFNVENPETDTIHKITATQCVNTNIIDKFNSIKFNYNILDKNGNNVLNRLIAQFNKDGIGKIKSKIWSIKTIKNNQGLNSIEFLQNNYNLIVSNWTPNNVNSRLNSYFDVLKNVVKSDLRFQNLGFGEEPFLQNIIMACMVYAFCKPDGDNNYDYDYDNEYTSIQSASKNNYCPLLFPLYKLSDDNGQFKIDPNTKNILNVIKMKIMNANTIYDTFVERCKKYVDFDKYEDSTYNELNKNIMNVIKYIIVHVIRAEFIGAINNYYEMTNTQQEDKARLIEETELLFDKILLFSIYDKLNIKNPNIQYADVDALLKPNILIKIREFTKTTENAEDDEVVNILINYYIFLATNIAFDFYIDANNFISDNINLHTLTEIEGIINSATDATIR